MTTEEIQAKLTQCVDSSKAFPLASLMGIATWSESWAKEEHAMPPSEWLAMTRATLAKLKPTNLKKFDEMIHALLAFSTGVYLLARGGYTLKIEAPNARPTPPEPDKLTEIDDYLRRVHANRPPEVPDA